MLDRAEQRTRGREDQLTADKVADLIRANNLFPTFDDLELEDD